MKSLVSALSACVLRIQGVLSPSGFLSSIRTVAEKLVRGTDQAKGDLGAVMSAALACVSTVSFDRQIAVQQFSPQEVPRQNHVSEKTRQQNTDTVRGTGGPPRISKTPSGLLGDPFQMRQWYLHSFFGNYTLGADRAWQKMEAVKSKQTVMMIVKLRVKA